MINAVILYADIRYSKCKIPIKHIILNQMHYSYTTDTVFFYTDKFEKPILVIKSDISIYNIMYINKIILK